MPTSNERPLMYAPARKIKVSVSLFPSDPTRISHHAFSELLSSHYLCQKGMIMFAICLQYVLTLLFAGQRTDPEAAPAPSEPGPSSQASQDTPHLAQATSETAPDTVPAPSSFELGPLGSIQVFQGTASSSQSHCCCRHNTAHNIGRVS